MQPFRSIAFALVAGAFVSLGLQGGCKKKNTNPPEAYEPCQNKSCGDSCTNCHPDDVGCIETADVKQCSAGGECLPAPVDCGEEIPEGSYDPCRGKLCGEYCTLCDPQDLDCEETAVLKMCNGERCTSDPVNCQ